MMKCFAIIRMRNREPIKPPFHCHAEECCEICHPIRSNSTKKKRWGNTIWALKKTSRRDKSAQHLEYAYFPVGTLSFHPFPSCPASLYFNPCTSSFLCVFLSLSFQSTFNISPVRKVPDTKSVPPRLSKRSLGLLLQHLSPHHLRLGRDERHKGNANHQAEAQ